MTEIIDPLYVSEEDSMHGFTGIVNDFALQLLMPEEDVRERIAEEKAKGNEVTIHFLAEQFEVMPKHVRIRVRQLGYNIKPKDNEK